MTETPFNLIMITAGFEHFGNGTMRFLCDHPNLLTYGFESQIGCNASRNILVPSLHPVRYGYPVFEEDCTYEQAWIDLWDEECKTYLRKPNRSKFQDCGIVMREKIRHERFLYWCHRLSNNGRTFRSVVIESYFRSFFDAWENLKRSGKETHFVGYVPGFTPETDRLFKDFPNCHVIHVVRNPWSAYADYLKRPFAQQTMEEYCMAYNITHTLAYNYARKYSGQYHIIRMEDLVSNPKSTLVPIFSKIGIPWDDNCLYPSFNGRDLSSCLCPWGTVVEPTAAYNKAMAESLSLETRDAISMECSLIIKTFNYNLIF